MDAHELVSALKQLAAEMGKAPTRAEFERDVKGASYGIARAFGTYTALLQAAGLPTYDDRRAGKVKRENPFLVRDIDEHLDQHKPAPLPEKKVYPKIAVLGDLHEPFGHDQVKADFVSFCEKVKPDYIVQVGDAFDAFCHGKFPRSHNVFTPKDEEQRARKNLEELWASLGKAAPQAKLTQMCGNHDLRPLKRVLESVPSIEHWAEKYFADLMSFDGVHTVIDPRQEFYIEDIAFLHGYRSKLGDHRDFMLMNAVCGHIHVGGTVFRKIRGQTLWELNAGFAADPNSKGLSYTSQKLNAWTLGWGYISELGPQFIPLR